MTKEEIIERLDHFNPDHVQPMTDILDEYMYPIQSFLKYMKTVKKRMDEYSELLSYCDLAEEDILHYIEFHRTNAADRSRLMNKLIDVRNVRRSIKTHIECIQIIHTLWLNGNYVKQHRALTDVLTRMNNYSNREYTDRTNIKAETLGGDQS